MNRNLFYVAVLLIAPMSTWAASQNSGVNEKPLVAQSLDSFQGEAAKVREQMHPGGIYGSMRSSDKARVEARLSDIEKILQAHASSSDLSTADKVALVNAEEEANSLLKHNDRNRLVCESRAPVGSHLPVTTCRTYGEIMDQQDRDQKFLMDRSKRPSPNPGGG